MRTTQVIASLYGSTAAKYIYQAMLVSRGARGFHVFLLNTREDHRCGWYRPLARSLLQRLWIFGERSTAIEDEKQQI